PFRPVVYGAGWEGQLPEGVELRGPADYNHDLPRIYRSDAVHLSFTNLQMRACPNQRVFDVGACGNAVLNDRLEGWTDLFGRDLDELLYDDVQTLVERTESLLASPERRRSLAETLRTVVLEKHTIRNRVETLLSLLQSRGNPEQA
ncbi:glycosyltransferase, partial [bacterium]|nr:glycosyltransferase [bacterium]